MHTFQLEELVFIDIETASCYPSFETMEPEWQRLWSEKNIRSLQEGMEISEHYAARAGVMAEFAQIVCISIGYFTNAEKRKMLIRSFYGVDEKQLLKDFMDALNLLFLDNTSLQFAGHNIREFDIPFICRRLLINRIQIPSYLDFQNKKPWEINLLDSFQYWRFGDYKNYTSLKLLAKALGVPSSKDEIDGSMVGALFWERDEKQRQENLTAISNYCRKDVLATANIFLRFMYAPLLQPDEIIFKD